MPSKRGQMGIRSISTAGFGGLPPHPERRRPRYLSAARHDPGGLGGPDPDPHQRARGQPLGPSAADRAAATAFGLCLVDLGDFIPLGTVDRTPTSLGKPIYRRRPRFHGTDVAAGDPRTGQCVLDGLRFGGRAG